MTVKSRHAWAHEAQLHIFTVPFEGSHNLYTELFQAVTDFLKTGDYAVLAVNGPYLEDEDTLALDVLVDDV